MGYMIQGKFTSDREITFGPWTREPELWVLKQDSCWGTYKGATTSRLARHILNVNSELM